MITSIDADTIGCDNNSHRVRVSDASESYVCSSSVGQEEAAKQKIRRRIRRNKRKTWLARLNGEWRDAENGKTGGVTLIGNGMTRSDRGLIRKTLSSSVLLFDSTRDALSPSHANARPADADADAPANRPSLTHRVPP